MAAMVMLLFGLAPLSDGGFIGVLRVMSIEPVRPTYKVRASQ
jgi:hypothetical protein